MNSLTAAFALSIVDGDVFLSGDVSKCRRVGGSGSGSGMEQIARCVFGVWCERKRKWDEVGEEKLKYQKRAMTTRTDSHSSNRAHDCINHK